ncbi:unnamed protein product [Linum trigynum]|uniref:Uncharacterized protein n=1 Tax=Linum trigynum TaxID=586398 RepID=A0AAV2DTF8_9ROSI
MIAKKKPRAARHDSGTHVKANGMRNNQVEKTVRSGSRFNALSQEDSMEEDFIQQREKSLGSSCGRGDSWDNPKG